MDNHARRSRLIGLLLAATVAVGCGGSTAASQAGAASSSPPSAATGPSTAPAVTPTISAAAPSASPASAAPPKLTGDAATNEACTLASVAEIAEVTEAGVKEMKGLTARGAYAETSLTCAWYLDAEEVGIPSVTVQWEFPVTVYHDPVVDLYESLVEQKLATRIEGVGDFAVLQGWTAEGIAPGRIVRVSVLLHATATPGDQEKATTLLRLLLERTEPE